LTSFRDHPEKQVGDYDGTVRILKLPKLHGFIGGTLPESDVYAIRVKKNGLAIEKIYLEPEEEEEKKESSTSGTIDF